MKALIKAVTNNHNTSGYMGTADKSSAYISDIFKKTGKLSLSKDGLVIWAGNLEEVKNAIKAGEIEVVGGIDRGNFVLPLYA